MKIDWWTLGLQTVNVLILIGLLARFLFQPVRQAVAARQAAAAKLLGEARKARDEALAEAQSLKARNDAFAQESQRQQAQWQVQAQAERERLMSQAGVEAAQWRSLQEQAARAQQDQERTLLQKQAGELAIRMSTRLLQGTAEVSADEALAQSLLAAARTLAPGQGAALAADEPLRLVLARPLPDSAALALALQQALGLRQVPAVEVDADLIAGCELAGQHARICHSWRADLEAMRASLQGNELG